MGLLPFRLLFNRLADEPPTALPCGGLMLASGSWQYEEAMKAYRWGWPRGYAVTWLTRHNKPHLYKAKG